MSFNIGCAFPVGIQIKIQIGQISELNSNLKPGWTLPSKNKVIADKVY